MQSDGYTADVERLTRVDTGWDDAACTRAPVAIADYGEGVVTPHASFLALDIARDAALENLAALRRDFPAVYGPGGFKDSINVATGQVAERYLALDQGMSIAALANVLLRGRLRSYMTPTLGPSIEPLMRLEQFSAGWELALPEPKP